MRDPRFRFLSTEAGCIDPDFDDEWNDCVLLQHEVDASGAINLHPDGNRIDFDPVPLHTRVYNDGTTGELKKREWAEHIRQWHRRELEDAQQQLASQQSRLDRSLITPPPGANPPPMPPEWKVTEVVPPWQRPTSRGHWIDRLLEQMRIWEPIPEGLARCWGDYAMINKSELDRWLAADPIRSTMPRVWADATRIIFVIR